MNNPKKLLKEYLSQGRVLQLATVSKDQPWISTVYFVVDDAINLYWLSFPTRRHSQEIAANNKIAITMPVKFDVPVIGVQAEGTAEVVNDPEEIKKIMKKYVEKYDAGKSFYENFIANKNQHVMYRFTPASYVLFDEVNFPDNGRQILNL